MKSSPEKSKDSKAIEKKNSYLPFQTFRTIVKSPSKENLSKPTNRSAVSFDQDFQAVSPTATETTRKEEKSPISPVKANYKLEKKRELQKNLQDHFLTSNSIQKTYTNARSQKIANEKRPNLKVEDILNMKGKETKDKLNKLEQELYGQIRSPSITKMARELQRDEAVYNRRRLYEIEKVKRKSSQEKSTSRRETLDKLTKSGSSPKFILNHTSSQKSLTGQDTTLKNTNSPLKNTLTEILSKAANKSINSPHKFDFSTYGNSSIHMKYNLSSPTTSARFLKPKPHTNENGKKPETAREFNYIPVKKNKDVESNTYIKSQDNISDNSLNQEISQHNIQKPNTVTFKSLSGFKSDDPSKSVLPNMLYFKNSDKNNKIIRADANFANLKSDREKSSNLDSGSSYGRKASDKIPNNELEKFYHQIANLDFKNKDGFESPKRDKSIITERNNYTIQNISKTHLNRNENVNKDFKESSIHHQLSPTYSSNSSKRESNITDQNRRISEELTSPNRGYSKDRPKTAENSLKKNPSSSNFPSTKDNERIQNKLYDYILNK